MNAADYDDLRRLFVSACDLSRAGQHALLSRIERERPGLRQPLADLLERDGGAVEQTDHDAPARTTPDDARPAHVGRYRIIRRIAVGGMGTVFEARQQSPRRTVALKLLHPSLASPSMVRRFRYEAEVLGRLSHPGIAQVYEADVAETPYGPQPFFAMELVVGEAITTSAQRRLDLDERIELLIRVCAAVEHAHQKGVIHRDLKPSNILVTDRNEPKVLDFGVALNVRGDLTTRHTLDGQLVGTVPYMSPEQASGDPASVDVRSDTYALGVLLFELLSGALPHEVRGLPIREALRRICEGAPARLREFDGRIPRDLDTVARKAISRTPAHRYQSASALSDDLRRYLDDQPVLARPPTRGYYLSKFARRNRALTISVLTTALILAIGVAGTIVGFVRALDREHARHIAQLEAEQAAETAERLTDYLTGMLRSVGPEELGRSVRVVDILDRASTDAATAEAPLVEARLRHALGEAYFALGRLSEAHEQLATSLERYALAAAARPHEVLRTRVALQVCSLKRGRLSGLAARTRLTLDDCVRELGVADATTLRARLLLATLIRRRGDNEGAEAQAAMVLELLGDGPDHEPRLRHEVSLLLAVVLRDRGELKAAAETLRAAATGAAIIGPYYCLSAANELGLVLVEQGRYAEAKRLYEEHLEAVSESMSRDSPLRLAAENNLALCHLRLGELAAAETLFLSVLERQRPRVGDEHIKIFGLLNNLALTCRNQGRLEPAREIWSGLAPVIARVLGDEHPYSLMTLQNLAGPVGLLGHSIEAESLYAEALTLQTTCRGPRHPDTLMTMDNLAELYAREGRLVEAELYCVTAYEGRRDALGPAHPFTLDTARILGDIKLRTGRPEEAASLLDAIADDARRALPRTKARLGTFLTHYGTALLRTQRLDEARSILHEAVAALRGTTSEGDEPLATALSSLALLYADEDDQTRAAPYRQLAAAVAQGRADEALWSRVLGSRSD